MEIQWKFSGNSIVINRQITIEFQRSEFQSNDREANVMANAKIQKAQLVAIYSISYNL
jgi:hypothetical protein